jgi:integrase
MKRLCKLAGVKYFRFHAIRHSGASVLANRGGIPPLAIQKILGHESLKTTEIYLHSLRLPETRAMAIFEDSSEDSHTDSHTVVRFPEDKSA